MGFNRVPELQLIWMGGLFNTISWLFAYSIYLAYLKRRHPDVWNKYGFSFPIRSSWGRERKIYLFFYRKEYLLLQDKRTTFYSRAISILFIFCHSINMALVVRAAWLLKN